MIMSQIFYISPCETCGVGTD